MCWVCDIYGDGGLWYLNPKNYARNLYRLRTPGAARAFGEDPETLGLRRMQEILETRFTDREEFSRLVKEANEMREKGPFQIGQVVPLQDAHKMVELSGPFAAMSCLCRIHTRAREERSPREYSCGGLGVGMLKWERWPERYKGGVHFMSPDEAKEWLTKWNKRGMVHIPMTFGGSFIGGLCNCDYPDCLVIRHRVDYGMETGCLKGHYVAKVDYDLCTGCGDCVQRCQFGALKLEVTTRKANIDLLQCFGCGLCETGCSQGAISLADRMSFPMLQEVW